MFETKLVTVGVAPRVANWKFEYLLSPRQTRMRETWIFCAIRMRVLAASSAVILSRTYDGVLLWCFATFSVMMFSGGGGDV